MGPRANETLLLVVEVGEFHLQRALAGLRPLPEDFEDEAGAIDDLRLPRLFEVALLNRRKYAVDDDKADALLADALGELVDLAGAEQRRRSRRDERHGERRDDLQVDGAGEAYRFFKAGISVAGRPKAFATTARDRNQHERTLRRARRNIRRLADLAVL